MESQKQETIQKGMQMEINLYHSQGFKLMDVHTDMEFECVQNDLGPIRVNHTPRDAHVGENHSIQTFKKWVWADVHSLPLKQLPKMVVIKLMRKAVRLFTQFPALNTTIMMDMLPIDYNTLPLILDPMP